MYQYQKILSQVPEDYYDLGIKSNSFQWIWHTWKWITLKSFVRDLEGEILDVGCADGTLTAKIHEYLPESKITGIDFYDLSIKYAKKRWKGINFVVADARKLPFGTGHFDSVVCVETLEHVPDNHEAVKEIFRVLKKGGTFIVCQDTDNLLFNIIWFFWTKWKGRVWNGAHISCMKPKELERLLVKFKFKIVERKFSHFGLEVVMKAMK